MTTVSNGTETVHPEVWMDYASSRTSGNRTHTLKSGHTAITLAPAEARRVKLALLFSDEAESKRAEDMHARPGVFTITEDGRPTHSMQYVVAGRIDREIGESRRVWILAIDVLEVTQP